MLRRSLARLALVCALALLSPQQAGAGFYTYTDDSGTVHIVDDPDLVPVRYRDRAADDSRAPRIQIQRGLDVPPASPSPPSPALEGGVPASFRVARLKLRGDEAKAGRWLASSDVAGKSRVRVIVAASWCPSCLSLFKDVSRDPSLRRAVDMVLFFDDEARRRPGKSERSVLTYPRHIAAYPLPYYLVRRSEFPAAVPAFPTILECSGERCSAVSRADFKRRFATR